jgi:hypothetical protein
MKKYIIRVEEKSYYNLSVEAESLEEVRQMAKDIKSYDKHLPDFVGGETPSSFGDLKTIIKEVK